MSKKLFIGSLAWGVNDQMLQTAFQAHGTVLSAKVVTDRATGRSRGFGFVEMQDDSSAMQAIQALNNFPLSGRNIIVTEAKPKQ